MVSVEGIEVVRYGLLEGDRAFVKGVEDSFPVGE